MNSAPPINNERHQRAITSYYDRLKQGFGKELYASHLSPEEKTCIERAWEVELKKIPYFQLAQEEAEKLKPYLEYVNLCGIESSDKEQFVELMCSFRKARIIKVDSENLPYYPRLHKCCKFLQVQGSLPSFEQQPSSYQVSNTSEDAHTVLAYPYLTRDSCIDLSEDSIDTVLKVLANIQSRASSMDLVQIKSMQFPKAFFNNKSNLQAITVFLNNPYIDLEEIHLPCLDIDIETLIRWRSSSVIHFPDQDKELLSYRIQTNPNQFDNQSYYDKAIAEMRTETLELLKKISNSNPQGCEDQPFIQLLKILGKKRHDLAYITTIDVDYIDNFGELRSGDSDEDSISYELRLPPEKLNNLTQSLKAALASSQGKNTARVQSSPVSADFLFYYYFSEKFWHEAIVEINHKNAPLGSTSGLPVAAVHQNMTLFEKIEVEELSEDEKKDYHFPKFSLVKPNLVDPDQYDNVKKNALEKLKNRFPNKALTEGEFFDLTEHLIGSYFNILDFHGFNTINNLLNKGDPNSYLTVFHIKENIDGEEAPISSFLFDRNQDKVHWFCSERSSFRKCMEQAERNFNEVALSPHVLPLETLKEKIGAFRYWMTFAHPYIRGSCSVAEVIELALYELHGYSIEHDKSVETADLQAIESLSLEKFLNENYRNTIRESARD